jgi:hypothetical protein
VVLELGEQLEVPDIAVQRQDEQRAPGGSELASKYLGTKWLYWDLVSVAAIVDSRGS